MRTNMLKESLHGLEAMPESELQFVSKDPQKALMDCAIYNRCKEQNNFSVWEKLKRARQIFN